MNRYLKKIASQMSDQTKDDLKTTAKVMAAGTISGGIGMGVNHMLGLSGKAIPEAVSHTPLKQKVVSSLKSAVSPKNLAAAGVLGVIGGVGDYIAIKHSKAPANQ